MIELRRPTSTRITGTVTARSGSRYTIEADDGRIVLADSIVTYTPGSRVTVISGAITSRAGQPSAVVNYQE